MKREIDQIQMIPLMSVFTREEISKFLDSGEFRIVTYKKNTVVHLEGEPCSKLEILMSGEVVVDRIDEDGNILSISRFREEEVLGGPLLFASNSDYILTVSAVQNTTLLEISKQCIFELCFSNQSFLEMYLQMISNHASLLGNKLKNHVERSLREKILEFLQVQTHRQGVEKIKLMESKKALAERFGVQRTSLSRELKKMKDEGLIDYDIKWIQMLK
ncbi:Crp/Fnr family transcriptional regulator [Gottschalkiaceae bacterium SANA]|nr:Crp/Fnr family transcriptional regulator [Gottschalkiaceae bacterium SANA]